MKTSGLIALGLGLFLSASLGAANSDELDLKDYDRLKNTFDFKLYLRGVGDAYMMANVTLEKDKQTPLFCPPKNLGLGVANYEQLIDDLLKKLRKGPRQPPNATPISLLMLTALQQTFPCQQSGAK